MNAQELEIREPSPGQIGDSQLPTIGPSSSESRDRVKALLRDRHAQCLIANSRLDMVGFIALSGQRWGVGRRVGVVRRL
jgi:hypothetical protein